MFHLGFCDPDRGLFYRRGRFRLKQYRADDAGSTICAPRKIRRAVEREQVLGGLHRIESLPISSRVSQNAAALLFDLGTVDIR
jgi:hypothetical protein